MGWISENKIAPLLDENNQLICIFVKSVETAQRNDAKSRFHKPKS
jgi:hypothetical protein